MTYSHDLEEPDNLEIALKTTQATPKFGNFFSGATLELEYGARGWWTTELYLSGQHTSNDSTVFTGFRWENRFRPLLHDHFINPVLYFEYENLNRADRSLLEVVGHDSISDLRLSNAQGRSDTERELEMKLILSSNAKGWNISENFIAEKNLNESEPWEFGTPWVSRPWPGAWQAWSSAARISPPAPSFTADWRSGRIRFESHLALRRAHRGFQYSTRADGQLLTQLRAQRQQRGSDLPHQGRVRISTNFELVPPERAMNSRTVSLVAGMMLCAALFSAAVDNSWIEKVPEADRNRRIPSPDKRMLSLPDQDCLPIIAPSVMADALGRGKRPSLRSQEVQQAGDGQIFWFLRNGNLRRGMPSWSSLPEPSRWQIIAYLKSLGEQASPGANNSPKENEP